MQKDLANIIKIKGVDLPSLCIERVGLYEQAQFYAKRVLKNESKLQALKTIISLIDLTTLEGSDTPEKVRQLCFRAKQPAPGNEIYGEKIPSVAAVCVYPSLVPVAIGALKGSRVQVASVATAFPAGQVSWELKLSDVKEAIHHGATEIDMVMNRNAFLQGKYQIVFDEIAEVKKICGLETHLKVILETGELSSFEKIRLASWIAMEAGADFIKTSTGKIQPAATLPSTLVMLQAIRDFFIFRNKKIGMKPAGGIRTTKQAISYLCMLNEVLGEEWMTPYLFRFGASRLLNDVIKQIFKQKSGFYVNEELFGVE